MNSKEFIQNLPEFTRKLYELDPDWKWDNNVMVVIPFEKLPASRVLELTQAAQGLATFVNAFERDIPAQALTKIMPLISMNGNNFDLES